MEQLENATIINMTELKYGLPKYFELAKKQDVIVTRRGKVVGKITNADGILINPKGMSMIPAKYLKENSD